MKNAEQALISPMSFIKSMAMAQLLLIVPLVGMQLSSEWNWQLSDFIFASILLAGLGVGAKLMIAGFKKKSWTLTLGIIVSVFILLLWAELAVGLFGTPFAGS